MSPERIGSNRSSRSECIKPEKIRSSGCKKFQSFHWFKAIQQASEHETKLSRTIEESTQVRRLKLPFV
jgi:hypothetical protein